MSKKPTYEDLKKKIEELEETAGKNMQELNELRASEAKLRIIADSSPTAVMMYQDDRWIFVNRAAEVFTGYSANELLKMNFWEIIHPDHAAIAREHGRKRQRGEETINRYEIMIVTKDGTEKWMGLTGASTMIDGHPAGVLSVADITERKQAEEALKASEERFRSLFNNAVEGVFHTTLDGRLVDANMAFARMAGYESPEEAVNRITDIAHQLYADPGDRGKAIDLLMNKGYLSNFECPMRRSDGSVFWVVINVRLGYLEGSSTPCIEGFVADITLRKEAEKALRESEERFRQLVENAPDGIYVQTLGEFTYVNRAAMRMFGGISPDQVLGRPVITRSHPDYHAAILERIRLLNEERKKVSSMEQKYLKLDGTPFDVEVSAVPFIYENRMGALVFFHEITERKKAEAALKESEHKYRAAFENSRDPIYITNDEGVFIDYNQAFLDLFGYTKEEMAGVHARDIYVDPARRDMFRKAIEEKGDLKDFEAVFRKKDGRQMDCLMTATMRRSDDGKALWYQGVIRDVTEKKLKEEQLRTMSIVDDLTGLYNRRGFFTLAQQQMKVAERARKQMFLFFADLDKMKLINDTLGHKAGDSALLDVAVALRKVFRESDIIGRMGGDEFAILAIDAKSGTGKALTERLHAILETYNLPGKKYRLSLSVGVAHYDPGRPSSLDELIARADRFMYNEKRKKNGQK